ncbi:uncharacterized protein KIAA2012 homolog [Phyllopteryx taeniolatus]|uniref:uncharacterized protein KIAA2012 homolog n=1 Tax=Phyllopteryx taeniolatus TaxID=161469 RepID=UPI002AD1EB17|nr:uncharacterized protein KIAA2012 homolog [Phyllopteryx taeniolatus]
MKDLSLSPLSRGCGRVIAASAGDHGRLDVCFTPQDYYIWKSYDALLRMTNSGSLLRSEDSTIPKTYSTRRGPLLLYSRGLVTLGTESGSQASERKRRVPRQHTQEVDHRPDAILRQNAQVRRRRRESSIIDEIHHNQHLPPTEDYHVTMGQASGTWTQQEVQTEPAWVGFQLQECQKDSHHQPLLLPLLLPVKKYEQINCKKKATERDKTRTQFCKEMLQHGQRSKKSSEVLLGPVDGASKLNIII